MKPFKLKSNKSETIERYIQPDIVREFEITEQEKSQYNRENHLIIFTFIDGDDAFYRSEHKSDVIQVLNDYLEHIEKYSQTKGYRMSDKIVVNHYSSQIKNTDLAWDKIIKRSWD